MEHIFPVGDNIFVFGDEILQQFVYFGDFFEAENILEATAEESERFSQDVVQGEVATVGFLCKIHGIHIQEPFHHFTGSIFNEKGNVVQGFCFLFVKR